ncbi:MAG: DNA-processing protein DprA [Clostridia bacterium]|nr:DNA-processing protein DprA [Clostridia bacterium]
MKYTEEEINLITLASFEELTYKNAVNLLDGLKRASPDFDQNEKILIKTLGGGVYNKVKDKFYSSAYREKVLQKLSERGIEGVTYFSPLYPERLKQTPCPPIALFCRGNVNLLRDRLFAVVGARATPPEYLKKCEKVSGEIASGLTIVSGCADGADTSALRGALKCGKAVCVLAYGFDHVYPSISKSLLKSVSEKGLIVTEYTPQVRPLPYNFPARNRIIAGLAEGVLVFSAGKKSGACITANYALEYGRQVFAIPYSPDVPCGEGCNMLIREGATLARDARDVLEDFGLKPEEAKEKTVTLTADERKLLDIIKEEGGALASVIAEKMNMLTFQLIPLLTALEIKGLIVRLGGNRYSAK